MRAYPYRRDGAVKCCAGHVQHEQVPVDAAEGGEKVEAIVEVDAARVVGGGLDSARLAMVSHEVLEERHRSATEATAMSQAAGGARPWLPGCPGNCSFRGTTTMLVEHLVAEHG